MHPLLIFEVTHEVEVKVNLNLLNFRHGEFRLQLAPFFIFANGGCSDFIATDPKAR